MPRIVFISKSFPGPPDAGGQQRSFLIAEALKDVGDLTLLLLLRRDEFPEKRDFVEQAFPGRVIWTPPSKPHERPPWRALARIAPRAAGGLAQYLRSGEQLLAPDPEPAATLERLVREEEPEVLVYRYLRHSVQAGLPPGPLKILDFDDVDATTMRSEAMQKGNPFIRAAALRQARQMETAQWRALASFDHVWAVSEADRRNITQAPASVLPNIPFRPEPPGPPTAPEHVIGVVATWSYAPNRRGLLRFIESVWPRIRAEAPGAVLRIFGRGVSEELRRAIEAIPGVEARGQVERIADAYAQSAFMIAPVYSGGGTKIKVIESLAMGRALVATPHAHEGLADVLCSGEHLLVGETPRDLADACLRLIRDPAVRDALAERGARIVNERFSEAAFRSIVQRTIESALASAQTREVAEKPRRSVTQQS